MIHELTIKQNIKKEGKKKKTIAHKLTTIEDEESDELEEGDEEDDLALIARGFKRFMRKKKQGFKKKPCKGEPSKDREKEKDKELPMCFECKKPNHFKMNYPLLKKLAKKIRKRQ